MRVLITGASGFLGKNLLLHCKSTWDLSAVYFSNHDFPAWLKNHGLSEVQPIVCDLTQNEQVKEQIQGPFDVVVHFAANGDPAFAVGNEVQDLQKNTVTTLQLLKEIEFKRFINFSSGAVYDGLRGEINPSIPVRPHLSYAISNLASEQYVETLAKGREYVIVRFFGAYGPYEPERKIFTKLIRHFGIQGETDFTIRGNGENLIDAMYVTDAVEIVKRIAERPIVQSILDVGCGRPISLTKLVQEAARAFGLEKPNVLYKGKVPEFIEFWMNPQPLKKHYDFTPSVSLAEGMQKLLKHLRA